MKFLKNMVIYGSQLWLHLRLKAADENIINDENDRKALETVAQVCSTRLRSGTY